MGNVSNINSNKKIRILQVVGGDYSNGAFQGANILHKALLREGISSVLLNDTFSKTKQKELLINNKNISFIQDNNLKKYYIRYLFMLKNF